MNHVDFHRQTYATVNIKNLKYNIRALKSVCKDYFFCPMVKSNAYGHGDLQVVKALVEEGVKQVGVALIEEGLRLRGYGYSDLDILIFGAIKENSFQTIIKNKFIPVITNWHELNQFSELGLNSYPVHIKFNTGMNRFGFAVSDASALKDFFVKSKALNLRGVCSHFYNGENISESDSSTQVQLKKFNTVLKLFPEVDAHIYNTPSYLNLLHQQKDLVNLGSRIGLAVYGSYPATSYFNKNHLKLKPVMSLSSEVVEYQTLDVGEKVSYAGSWQAKRRSIIGVVPIGYTDGYGREFSNKGQMIYRGQLVSVIGKICMDYTMVDLSDVLQNDIGQIGEEIVLFGKQQNLFVGVEEFAERVGKIPYEILTTLGRRVPRKYILD